MVAPLGHDGSNPHVAPPRVRGADEDGGVPLVAAPLTPVGVRHDVDVGERVVDGSVQDIDPVEALYLDVAHLVSIEGFRYRAHRVCGVVRVTTVRG